MRNSHLGVAVHLMLPGVGKILIHLAPGFKDYECLFWHAGPSSYSAEKRGRTILMLEGFLAGLWYLSDLEFGCGSISLNDGIDAALCAIMADTLLRITTSVRKKTETQI